MSPTPKTAVRPVRIHVPHADVTATVVRGVGFRFVCDCGERGSRRGTYSEARKDLRLHRLEHVG